MLSKLYISNHSSSDCPSSKFKIESWKTSSGDFHRERGPAYIRYSNSGKIVRKEWWVNGQRHRESDPAILEYTESGIITGRRYYVNGKRHRTDGPACVGFYKSGKIEYVSWWLNGKRHRTNGPATIDFNKRKRIKDTRWYLNGKRIYPDEWLGENGYTWKTVKLNEKDEIDFILRFA